jgi:phenylalanyl-tRNA synthetase beta chain
VAVVVDEDVEAGSIVAVAREAGGSELRDARIFDVYHGDQVPEGRKSVAVHLAFQASDRTLTDEEADAARARVVEALRNRFGAELRG